MCSHASRSFVPMSNHSRCEGCDDTRYWSTRTRISISTTSAEDCQLEGGKHNDAVGQHRFTSCTCLCTRWPGWCIDWM